MAREAYVILFGRIAQVLTLIILLRVITGQLSPEEIGKTTIITSLTAFFALLFVNPVGMYIKRQFNDWFGRGLVMRYLGFALMYLIGITVFSTSVVSLVYLVFEPNWGVSLFWLIGLVAGSLIINTVNQTLIPCFNMLGYRVYWVFFTIVTLWSGLLFSWLLTQYSSSAEYWMLGQLLGLAVGVLFSIVPFKKIVGSSTGQQLKWEVKELKLVLAFTLPIAVTVALNWSQFQSYRFLLGEFSGLEVLGLFSAGYAVSAGIITNFEATIQQYFHPIFYKAIHGKSDEVIAEIWLEYVNLLIPFIAVTGIFVVIFSESITHILVDEKYWVAAKFVALGAVVESVRAISNAYSLVAHALMRTRVLLASQITGAISMAMSVRIIFEFWGGEYFWYGLVFSSLLFLSHLVLTIKFSLQCSYGFRFMLPVMVTSVLFLVIRIILEDPDRGLGGHLMLLSLSGSLYVLFGYFLFRRNLDVEMKYMGRM